MPSTSAAASAVVRTKHAATARRRHTSWRWSDVIFCDNGCMAMVGFTVGREAESKSCNLLVQSRRCRRRVARHLRLGQENFVLPLRQVSKGPFVCSWDCRIAPQGNSPPSLVSRVQQHNDFVAARGKLRVKKSCSQLDGFPAAIFAAI